MSWTSWSGPPGQLANPDKPSGRQNGREYTATVFVVDPIHTGMIEATARRSGSRASPSIMSLAIASEGGIATTATSARRLSSARCTATASLLGSMRCTAVSSWTTPSGSRAASASMSAPALLLNWNARVPRFPPTLRTWPFANTRVSPMGDCSWTSRSRCSTKARTRCSPGQNHVAPRSALPPGTNIEEMRPPSWRRASMSLTTWPARTRPPATARPLIPPPTTTTSGSHIRPRRRCGPRARRRGAG